MFLFCRPVFVGSTDFLLIIALWLAGSAMPVMAERFPLPDGDSVIGEFGKARAEHQDTLLDIARHNSLGYNEIRLANEHVDTWLPGDGQEVVLPKRFILPAAPREGLVLNIPEMRLYHYTSSESGEPEVVTYPLGIGREGWSTPYETTKVTAKVADPAWYPPHSRRACRGGRSAAESRSGRAGQPARRLCHAPGAAKLPDPRHQ